VVGSKGTRWENWSRGYNFKPYPAESALRSEIGKLRSELFDLKEKSAAASELSKSGYILF